MMNPLENRDIVPDHQAMADILSSMASGWHEVGYRGSRYGLVLERVSPGQAGKGHTIKGVARELGGDDYISFNLFQLSSGRLLLKPCEMPEAKVLDFILNMDAGT